MTLRRLKVNLKFLAIISLLAFYGLGAFILGKIIDFGKRPYSNDKSGSNLAETRETPIPSLDAQNGKVISSHVKLCASSLYSFEISYPKDWFTTYNDDSQKCTFFAPYSFVVPADVAKPFVPIKVEVITLEEWPQTAKFIQNPNDFLNVLSVSNAEINGRSSQKVIGQTTGVGFLPKGYLKISYLVYDSNHPLVLSYEQLEKDEQTQNYRTILEEMVTSLRFF